MQNVITTKRFVIRKSLIGKNQIIQFVNKKGDTCEYNHDKVYTQLQSKFDEMPCFTKVCSRLKRNSIMMRFLRQIHEVLVIAGTIAGRSMRQ